MLAPSELLEFYCVAFLDLGADPVGGGRIVRCRSSGSRRCAHRLPDRVALVVAEVDSCQHFAGVLRDSLWRSHGTAVSCNSASCKLPGCMTAFSPIIALRPLWASLWASAPLYSAVMRPLSVILLGGGPQIIPTLPDCLLQTVR